jgi:hypothetical protein
MDGGTLRNDTVPFMRYLHRLFGAMALYASVTCPVLADDCQRPTAAPSVPDGAKATTDQFKAAHPTIQAYVQALDAYQDCITAKIKQIPAGTKPDDVQKLRADGSAALDEAKAVSDAYSAQVKIYKTTGQGRSTGTSAPH